VFLEVYQDPTRIIRVEITMQSLLVILLIFGACGYVTAQIQFQAEAYGEGSCVKPPPPPQVDANWVGYLNR